METPGGLMHGDAKIELRKGRLAHLGPPQQQSVGPNSVTNL